MCMIAISFVWYMFLLLCPELRYLVASILLAAHTFIHAHRPCVHSHYLFIPQSRPDVTLCMRKSCFFSASHLCSTKNYVWCCRCVDIRKSAGQWRYGCGGSSGRDVLLCLPFMCDMSFLLHMANHFQQQLTFSIFPTLICVRYHFIVSVELSMDPVIRMRWQPSTIHFLFDHLNKNILLQFGITWTPFNNYNFFKCPGNLAKTQTTYIRIHHRLWHTHTHKQIFQTRFSPEWIDEQNMTLEKGWQSTKKVVIFGLIVWFSSLEKKGIESRIFFSLKWNFLSLSFFQWVRPLALVCQFAAKLLFF